MRLTSEQRCVPSDSVGRRSLLHTRRRALVEYGGGHDVADAAEETKDEVCRVWARSSACRRSSTESGERIAPRNGILLQAPVSFERRRSSLFIAVDIIIATAALQRFRRQQCSIETMVCSRLAIFLERCPSTGGRRDVTTTGITSTRGREHQTKCVGAKWPKVCQPDRLRISLSAALACRSCGNGKRRRYWREWAVRTGQDELEQVTEIPPNL